MALVGLDWVFLCSSVETRRGVDLLILHLHLKKKKKKRTFFQTQVKN